MVPHPAQPRQVDCNGSFELTGRWVNNILLQGSAWRDFHAQRVNFTHGRTRLCDP
jgi:hypothetical protein